MIVFMVQSAKLHCRPSDFIGRVNMPVSLLGVDETGAHRAERLFMYERETSLATYR